MGQPPTRSVLSHLRGSWGTITKQSCGRGIAIAACVWQRSVFASLAIGGTMAGRVEKVFAEVLNISTDSINEATSPDNTPEWDSASNIDLTLAIEDEFRISFTTKEMVAMRSVALVKKVLAMKGITDV
jgi:acyl carrier protein